MKKKSKKYINGGIFAALLLASISVRTMAGADNGTEIEENMMLEDYRANEDTDQEDITEKFSDFNFRLAIRSELGLGENEPITKSNCASIQHLYMNYLSGGDRIESYKGIENLTNLRELYCYSRNAEV